MEQTTLITNPTHITFVTNEIIALAGNNGFALFNLNTQQYTHLQQDKKIDDLALNKSKSKIATSCNGLLTVYDTTHHIKLWEYDTQTNCFAPITFDSQNEEQLIAYADPIKLLLLQHGSCIKQYTTHMCNTSLAPIICHPDHTTIMYTPHLTGRRYKRTSCRVFHIDATLDDSDVEIFGLAGTPFVNFATSSNAVSSAYITKNGWLCLKNLQTQQQCLFRTSCINALFHPNNKFLITLSHTEDEPYLLQYRDFNTLISTKHTAEVPELPKPFASHSLDKHCPSAEYQRNGKMLAISPDNKFIAVTLFPDRCYLLPIPFEMIAEKLYATGTLEKCTSIFLMLKEYEDGFLPHDMASLITYYLLLAQRYEPQLD